MRAEGKPQGEDPPRDGLGGRVTAAVSSSPPALLQPKRWGGGPVSDSLTPTPMEVG